MPDARHDAFAEAIVEVIDALAAGGEPSSTAVIVLQHNLERVARSAGATENDAPDVAGDAIVRFVIEVKTHRLDRALGGTGLATAIARNLAVDVHRRRRHYARLASWDDPSDEDDDVAQMLEARASADAIHVAFRAATDLGDYRTVHVVVAWLNLANGLGRAPTSREAAEAAGVSHTSVRRALDAFRAFVPEDPRYP